MLNGFRETGSQSDNRIWIDEILQENELVAAQILEELSDGIMLVNADATVRHVNKALEKMLGYTAEELVGKSALDLPTYGGQDNLEKGAALFEEVLNKGFAEPVDMDAVTKDGKVIPLSFSATVIRDKAGNPTVFAAVIRDITERKRNEEMLRESEEKLKRYLEGSPDVICVVGEKGIISYVNRAVERITGYSRDEIVGQSFVKLGLLAPESSSKPAEWRQLNEDRGTTRDQEIALMRKDGSRVFVEVSTLSTGSPGRQARPEVIGIARDITERKQAECERLRLTSELAEKNKELEQIVYVASHDLRSPLVNVQGFSKELRYSLREVASILQGESIPSEVQHKISNILESDIADSLRYIEASVSKMDSLLAGLLRLSRLGRVALRFEQLDMNLLIREIVEAFEYAIKEVGANVKVSHLPPCVGDHVQINQLFSNLLDNALKYRDPERAAVIEITGQQANDQVVYCVRDNGIGIVKEHYSKIFEIFQRLNPGATSGEGLGLSIVKKILSRHNGSIWVESEPGVGSKFSVSLPLVSKTVETREAIP